jgi:hypothetical protein
LLLLLAACCLLLLAAACCCLLLPLASVSGVAHCSLPILPQLHIVSLSAHELTDFVAFIGSSWTNHPLTYTEMVKK